MNDGPFRYCLNTSTVRGHGLALVEEVELVAEAGYDGIEPWIREMDAHVAGGGSLEDVAGRAGDLGLAIENAIGFFEWIVDDDALRRKGFEEARRNMEMLARLGCPRLAAPPYGAADVEGLDPMAAADRYAELVEVGAEFGVAPMVEFWGMSRSLRRLGEAVCVAVQSGRREACVLADVFHMYKGGSPFEGLALLGPDAIGLMHVNDYPDAPAAELTDADRVYPGDGAAPLVQILRDLDAIGFRGPLSLELFNESYWTQEAAAVARTGLDKLRALVEEAVPEA